MSVRIALLLAIAMVPGAVPAAAQRRPDPCAPHPQTFLSPAGEPFRAAAGAPPPVASWFAQADRDRDGRLTAAEVTADAMRFFAVVDADHDGEIVPDELSRYEREIAPEVSTYDPTPPSGRAKKQAYGAPLGAGRYALLNVPNPIAAADLDYNRGTSRAEFAAAAARAFVAIAGGRAAVRLTELPPTPQAATIAACAAKAQGTRR